MNSDTTRVDIHQLASRPLRQARSCDLAAVGADIEQPVVGACTLEAISLLSGRTVHMIAKPIDDVYLPVWNGDDMSAATPRVSLLMPCYKSQAYIARAVRSALLQTYAHLEIIVAPDDGDTYRELRDAFTSPQLRILAPGNATGPGASRNRAIDASTGDYLTMLDSDDRIPPTYIADLMDVAILDGAAIGTTRYLDWDSRSVVRCLPMHDRRLSLLSYGQLLASVHPLVHRSIEPAYVGGFAEDVVHDGTVIAKMGTVSIVPSAVYEAHIRAGSACSGGGITELEIQQAYLERVGAILDSPTSIGVHGLSIADRSLFADLFRFRALASAAFLDSGTKSYHAWVSGREAWLWDVFTGSAGEHDSVAGRGEQAGVES